MIKKEKLVIANKVRKNKHLNEEQYQIALGGLLGDSSIRVRGNGQCSIKLGHTDKQKDYLEWKRGILNSFILSDRATVDNSSSMTKNTFYVYTTIVHQDFTDLYGMLYRLSKGKKIRNITRKVLNGLTEFGLLIWYLDDGCIAKDKDVRIYSNRYSLSEHKAIKIWFWQKYRITCIIAYNRTAKCYYLRFNVKNTRKLFGLFQKYLGEIPMCMRYKFKKVLY